jgi:hypothetical protein
VCGFDTLTPWKKGGAGKRAETGQLNNRPYKLDKSAKEAKPVETSEKRLEPNNWARGPQALQRPAEG